MKSHTVDRIHFEPRTEHDPAMVCACGWQGDSRTYVEHRLAVGLRRAHGGQWLTTPDDQGRGFMPRMTADMVCSRKHVNQWRTHADGRRTCRGCAAQLERDRRAAERAHVSA